MNKVPFQGKRKLLLLHGPAIASSRQKLIELKQKFDPNNAVVYEAGISMQEVLGSLMTLPLMAEERLIILENPPEDFSNYTLYSNPYTLIIWFDHEVSEKKPVMSWMKKNGQVLYFPEAKEVSVFPFLDYLAASDKKAFLELDKLKKGGFDIQYLITMIFYMLRNLVVEPKTTPDFVRRKLIRQRERFNVKDIEYLYKSILEMDFKIKSGLLETAQAEFSLVNLFCH